MADIRVQYLKYQNIEARANSTAISGAQIKGLVNELEELKDIRLDKKFAMLNSKVMYPSEVDQEIGYRNAKIESLLARLKRIR